MQKRQLSRRSANKSEVMKGHAHVVQYFHRTHKGVSVRSKSTWHHFALEKVQTLLVSSFRKFSHKNPIQKFEFCIKLCFKKPLVPAFSRPIAERVHPHRPHPYCPLGSDFMCQSRVDGWGE